MKTADPTLVHEIRWADEVQATPKFVVEFEMNRYFSPSVDNKYLDALANPEPLVFPISSIALPNRPSKGMNKARIGESVISPGYVDKTSPRFYIASEKDIYQYWQAPSISDASGNIEDTQPYIIYSKMVTVNKLKVQVENTWATPKDWTVEVTTDNITWSTIATNPTLNNDGTLTLYYNGTGWTKTKPATLTATRQLRGIRLTVNTLKGGVRGDGVPTTYIQKTNGVSNTITTNGSFTRFSLIGMGLAWEIDMTERVIANSDTFDYGDTSQVTPLGEVTSNQATVNLWNGDHWLSNDNPDSPYQGMIDANARCNLSYIYVIEDVLYEVQQFNMLAQIWSGQRTEVVSLSLLDESKIFNETKPRAALFQDKSLPEIVCRLCDSIGFQNYKIDIDTANLLTQYNIPAFWVDGKTTLWEVFNSLAEASQSSIYFDAFGVLRVRTREAAFDTNRPVDWKILGEDTADGLADIVSMSQTEAYEANHIKVKYTPRAWSDFNNGVPALQTLWEPDGGSLVVRATELARTLENSDEVFYINQADAKLWPYTSLVNIGGEILEYDAKEFLYYTGTDGTTTNYVWTFSEDDHKKYNLLSPTDFQYKNDFTGKVRIKRDPKTLIIRRGLAGTIPERHPVQFDTSTWISYVFYKGNTIPTGDGFTWDAANSQVKLIPFSGAHDTNNDLTLMLRGARTKEDANAGTAQYYGTSIKFIKGYSYQVAGMVICNAGTQNSQNGYYIQIRNTASITDDQRNVMQELAINVMINGTTYLIASIPWAIVEDTWYNFDFHFDPDSHLFITWINGTMAMVAGVPAGLRIGLTPTFGIFTQGHSGAYFDYVYSIGKPSAELADDFGLIDRLKGGYESQAYKREFVYKMGAKV